MSGFVELRRSDAVDQLVAFGELIERPQTLFFAITENVLNIVPQVRLALRRALGAAVRRSDFVRGRNATVASVGQRLDRSRRRRARTTGPERPHEGQPGKSR